MLGSRQKVQNPYMRLCRALFKECVCWWFAHEWTLEGQKAFSHKVKAYRTQECPFMCKVIYSNSAMHFPPYHKIAEYTSRSTNLNHGYPKITQFSVIVSNLSFETPLYIQSGIECIMSAVDSVC